MKKKSKLSLKLNLLLKNINLDEVFDLKSEDINDICKII